MLPPSLLHGENAAWLDQQYLAWQGDPQAVEPALATLFEGLDAPPSNGRAAGQSPSFRPRSIFDPVGRVAGNQDPAATERRVRVVQLINAYRVRGHLDAAIDPLDRREKVDQPELELAHYGLGPDDTKCEH